MHTVADPKYPVKNPFRFDPVKALEILVYLATHLPYSTFFYISKILFYADVEHLQKYGRFTCGDNYVAMENGPVPSNVYDILKDAGGIHLRKFFDIPSEEALKITGYDVAPLREANLNYLSETDIECLDKAIAAFGKKSFGELKRMTHEEVAYKEADAITNDMSVFVMAENVNGGGKDLVNLLIGEY